MNASTETRFPIPAVRLIVTDDAGRILILRRSNTRHGADLWCLPGGKVDYGDTVDDAVRKELKEETGLDCVEARFLFYQDSLPLTPGTMHCINFYFACRTSGEVALNEESSAFRWIGQEELAATPLAFRNGEGLERYWRDGMG